MNCLIHETFSAYRMPRAAACEAVAGAFGVFCTAERKISLEPVDIDERKA